MGDKGSKTNSYMNMDALTTCSSSSRERERSAMTSRLKLENKELEDKRLNQFDNIDAKRGRRGK